MKVIIDIPEKVLKTRYYTDYFGCGSHKLTETLDNATPYRSKGHWIHLRSDMYECSECGKIYTSFEIGKCDADYCPKCGVDMRGDTE